MCKQNRTRVADNKSIRMWVPRRSEQTDSLVVLLLPLPLDVLQLENTFCVVHGVYFDILDL